MGAQGEQKLGQADQHAPLSGDRSSRTQSASWPLRMCSATESLLPLAAVAADAAAAASSVAAAAFVAVAVPAAAADVAAQGAVQGEVAPHIVAHHHQAVAAAFGVRLCSAATVRHHQQACAHWQVRRVLCPRQWLHQLVGRRHPGSRQ